MSPVYSVGEIVGLAQAHHRAGLWPCPGARRDLRLQAAHGSGHIYMSAEGHADAVIDAVCWRGSTGLLKLSIRPADGIEVIATGRLTTYPRPFEIPVHHRADGAGRRRRACSRCWRTAKSASSPPKGCSRPRASAPCPICRTVIGIITSPTGAVIRDILHRLDERFPRHVLLWPVAVQGEARGGPGRTPRSRASTASSPAGRSRVPIC